MKIPETNVMAIYIICTVGGYGSEKELYSNNGYLCKSEKVNKYARFRPGYWYVDTSGNLAFQRPRGGTQNDPRGTRPDGNPGEVFDLADFRGYNPAAVAPSINTGGTEMEVVFASDQAGKTVPVEVVFNLGEVDWFGEETKYWGRNNISSAYDTLYAYRGYGTTGRALVGSCHKDNLERSGYTARAPIDCQLTVPPTGSVEYEIFFALGYAEKAYAYFPNTIKVKLTLLSGAIMIVRVLSSAISGLKSKLTLVPSNTGDSPSDLQEIIVYGGEKSYTSAVITASFDAVSFIARMSSGNTYRFTSLRLQATGTVYCYDRPMYDSGAVLRSQKSFNVGMAASGDGTYSMSVSLPEAAGDGKYFYIDISSFTSNVSATLI